MRLAGGRLLCGGSWSGRFTDQQGRAFVGRDAFNGLPLWDRPETNSRMRPKMERVTVADGTRVISVAVEGEFARAIDARTGKDLRIYDQGLRSVVTGTGRNGQGCGATMVQALVGGQLLQGQGRDVVSLDVASGTRQWGWQPPDGQTVAWMAVGGGMVYVAVSDLTETSFYSYNNFFWFISRVAALDLATGRQVWVSDAVKDFSTFGLVYADGGVFVQHAGILRDRFFSTEPGAARASKTSVLGPLVRLDGRTGTETWRTDVGATEPKDTFWHNQFRVQDGAVYPGFGTVVRGFDVMTGEAKPRLFAPTPNATHHVIGFCSQVRGVGRGQIGGKFASFIDFSTGTLNFVSVARNNCDVGHFPAYGNIYTGSDGCGCAQFLRGTTALNSSQPVPAPVPDQDRLERGVAVQPAAADPEGAWPFMLGDDSASSKAASGVVIADKAKPAASIALPVPPAIGVIGREWQRSNARLGAVTPPVVAGDLLVAAVTDTHEVHGLDARTGARRWTHRAGGRIDSSPTCWRGLVLFGASDGTVTALRASDGALAWRFLAAPERRSIVVDGQVESLWPVHGTVLVVQGKVFAVAGRHTSADGGLWLWRLDAVTGAIEARERIDTRATNEGDAVAPLYELQGVIADALVMNGQGNLVTMGQVAIDPATLAWANLRLVNWPGDKPVLDGRPNPFRRPVEDYIQGSASIGRNTPGLLSHINAPTMGLIERRAVTTGTKGQSGLRFGTTYNYNTKYQGRRLIRDGTTLYAANPNKFERFEMKADWSAVRPVGRDGKDEGTILAKPVVDVAEGAILSGERFYLGGDRTIAILGKDGSVQGSLTVPGRMAMHGLSAAHGRLYVTQADGVIQVYAP
jgi:outer membrane protein assembly factor BamB